MAVVLAQVLAQSAQVKAGIDAAQQMILRNNLFEIKRVEQSFLPTPLSSHHRSTQTKML